MIGSHQKPEDYAFQRQSSRYSGEWEHTKPPQPLWKDFLAGALMIAFMTVIVILTLAS